MDNSDFTILMKKAAEGDQDAKLQFSELVYEELRDVAAKVVARRGGGDQPTSIVNEFFERRLLNTGYLAKMKGRRYFYGAAFNQMRNLLIDRARKRKPKPVADTELQPLDQIVAAIEEQNGYDIEALNMAIESLEQEHPRQCEVLRARIWGGMTIPQTAELLDVSEKTIERDYRVARAKLKAALKRRGGD